MKLKPINFVEALGATILLFAFEYIVAITIHDFGIGVGSGGAISNVVVFVSTGFLITILMSMTGINYAQVFHSSSNSVKSTIVVTLPLLMLIFIAATWWYSDLITVIVYFVPEDRDSLMVLSNMLRPDIFAVLSVCIIGPVLEEILFRGLILRSFLYHYAPKNAILLSSLLFSFVHLNWYQMPSAFFLGCFIGWLFYLTRSLWPCILAHVINNSLAFMSAYYWPKEDFNSLLMNLLTFALSVVGVLLISRLFSASSEHSEKDIT
ncbi:type II CAAX endopeptidase family protein [Litoribacillus peritrichatus]|uniref:CAAX prenyl protease 2/Lysostaphin resistance protein A-like domain-containing protein n=1 Tax=Litoribacillus peritrichatus TaxID=718191 RepID=A0ABP7MDS7_9GAMM